MQVNRILKYTANSRVYKLVINEAFGGCSICAPNKGCDRNRNENGSWKTYRKTQW